MLIVIGTSEPIRKSLMTKYKIMSIHTTFFPLDTKGLLFSLLTTHTVIRNISNLFATVIDFQTRKILFNGLHI